MQYSLWNRFCGVLIGAATGERLETLVERPQRSPLAAPIPGLAHELQSSVPRHSRWMSAIAQSLIACQTLDLTDCQHRLSEQPEPRSPVKKIDLSEMAIATLPLALFFHESGLKLRQALQSISQLLGAQPESALGAWVVGWAIAQALQEKLHPPTLIEQMLTDLPIMAPETVMTVHLSQQLQRVQWLVNQRAGLETARMQLIRQAAEQVDPMVSQQTTAIALALYCWLSTPEDSQLAMLRSQRCAYRPTIVGALTGALVGAYNGRTSLPASWCLAVEPLNQATTLEPSQPSPLSWATVAADLLATWSGAYDLRDSPSQPRQLPAIAAPRVIRPR